jgi:hypothetical protein
MSLIALIFFGSISMPRCRMKKPKKTRHSVQVGGTGVLQPKRHHSVVEVALECPESGVESVLRVHLDPVLA